MKSIILPALLALLFFKSAFSQSKNYDRNGAIPVLSDQTKLTIEPIRIAFEDHKMRSFGILPGLTALLPPMVDFGVSTYQYLNKKRVQSFTGEYVCNNSSCCLTVGGSTVDLPRLMVVREVLTKGGEVLVASKLELSPELSENNMAFRYKLETLDYRYSIAKTKGPYDYLDLDIQIALRVLALKEHQYELKDFRTSVMKVESVRVGGDAIPSDTIYSGWFPLVGLSMPGGNVEANAAKDDGPLVSGVYEMEVKVTEYNPYKVRAEDRKQYFEDSKDSFSALIKKAIEQINIGK